MEDKYERNLLDKLDEYLKGKQPEAQKLVYNLDSGCFHPNLLHSLDTDFKGKDDDGRNTSLYTNSLRGSCTNN